MKSEMPCPGFLKPYVKDAVEYPDVDILSAILGITRKEAEKIVIRNNEITAGFKEREVFCTKETRELEREILEIVASYTTTKNGKEKVLTLTPTCNRDVLQNRFRDLKECEHSKELQEETKRTRVHELLSKAELTNVSFGDAPLVVIRKKNVEAEVKEKYGDFVHVDLVDSTDKAKELLQRGNIILLISEGQEGIEESGIVNISSSSLSDPCEIYPEFVVNTFIAKKKAIESIISLLTDFEGLKDSHLFADVPVEDLEAVLALIEEIEKEKSSGETNFDEVIYQREEELNREADRIMRSGRGVEEFKGYLEESLVNMADALMFSREERDILWESAYEDLERGLPFEFSREKIARLRQWYTLKMGERRYYLLRDSAKHMAQYREEISNALKKFFYFDFILAVVEFSRDFSLIIPEISEAGLGVVTGRNLFLVHEELRGGETVVPVSYAIGKSDLGIFGATPHPIAILTGANSGGKTCLLLMLASSIILTELGLPVPAERAEIPLIPLYFYRRKMIKKTGSFEYSMRALSRIFMREGAKVVLIDELEALTEPGAMGRIMASLLNNLPKDTLAVVITHLIHEILPHLSLEKVRVDGIESEGLDEAGNIIVDRQPMFNHVGSSTPELVIKKLLGRVRKGTLKTVYEEMITVLEKERESWDHEQNKPL
jgi:dsDNA-specific endonuclease/ATPase MutS2